MNNQASFDYNIHTIQLVYGTKFQSLAKALNTLYCTLWVSESGEVTGEDVESSVNSPGLATYFPEMYYIDYLLQRIHVYNCRYKIFTGAIGAIGVDEVADSPVEFEAKPKLPAYLHCVDNFDATNNIGHLNQIEKAIEYYLGDVMIALNQIISDIEGNIFYKHSDSTEVRFDDGENLDILNQIINLVTKTAEDVSLYLNEKADNLMKWHEGCFKVSANPKQGKVSESSIPKGVVNTYI